MFERKSQKGAQCFSIATRPIFLAFFPITCFEKVSYSSMALVYIIVLVSNFPDQPYLVYYKFPMSMYPMILGGPCQYLELVMPDF